MNSIQTLIKQACPAIAYRTRREILRESLSDVETGAYLAAISAGKRLNAVLGWQHPDGYFGTRLHTAPSGSKVWPHEGCVRYLLEMGLPPDFPPLAKALEATLAQGWGKECEGSKAAIAFGYGVIRACLFAQAEIYDYDFVDECVEVAMSAFRCLAYASSLDDITRVNKSGKYFYADDARLPTIYQARLLAFTQSWRTDENIQTVSDALRRLYDWLPLPPVYIKAGSQLIAPLGTIHQPLNCDFREKSDFFWLHFYEMIGRMGMLGPQSPFGAHIRDFADVFAHCNKGCSLNYGGYSGFSLEDDWRIDQRRVNDLSFRCHLIRSKAEKGFLALARH